MNHTTAHERAAPMRAERSGPLADVRIVDLTQALAGPYCTMILADLGADVIKVEPKAGDGIRQIGAAHRGRRRPTTSAATTPAATATSAAITLDLKDRGRRGDPASLVDTADIVVENFRAGVMEALGSATRRCARRNPTLVYGAIRGFGDPRTGAGPYTDWPAYDVVAQAMGGVVSYTGTKGGEHVACGPERSATCTRRR